MAEMRTLTCPGPPQHEFQHLKGRGRPPKYCDAHKANAKASAKEENKVSETRKAPPGNSTRSAPGKSETRSAPPGARKAPRVAPPVKGPADEPIDSAGIDPGVRRLPPPGKNDTQSRAKAEGAVRHADAQQPEYVWPQGMAGRPMARIEFAAAELIPTGQYANVSVGPARITAFVDLDRELGDDETYFTQIEASNLTKAVNELAEMVERDVVAVQRNLVLESIQGASNGNS